MCICYRLRGGLDVTKYTSQCHCFHEEAKCMNQYIKGSPGFDWRLIVCRGETFPTYINTDG